MKRIHPVLLAVLLAGNVLVAGEWHVEKSSKNKVVFNSSTTLLDFSGTTDAIDGYYYCEGDTLFGANQELYFEVQLETFDTGISKRDRDMREDVLETEKHPLATFKGNMLSVKRTGDGYDVISEGEMSLHGHTKKMTIVARIVGEGDDLTITSKFSVMLKDYEISAPSLLAFVKVADEIKIDLNCNLKKVK